MVNRVLKIWFHFKLGCYLSYLETFTKSLIICSAHHLTVDHQIWFARLGLSSLGVPENRIWLYWWTQLRYVGYLEELCWTRWAIGRCFWVPIIDSLDSTSTIKSGKILALIPIWCRSEIDLLKHEKNFKTCRIL